MRPINFVSDPGSAMKEFDLHQAGSSLYHKICKYTTLTVARDGMAVVSRKDDAGSCSQA